MTHAIVTVVIGIFVMLTLVLFVVKSVTRHPTKPRPSSDTRIIEFQVASKSLEARKIADEQTQICSPPPPLSLTNLASELLSDEQKPHTLSDSATLKTIHIKAETIQRLSRFPESE